MSECIKIVTSHPYFMNETQFQPTPQPVKKENVWFEVIRFIIIVLAIVLPVRLLIAQPYIVSGASMDPAFETGEYIVVDLLSYEIGQPQRGQVVVFRYPNNPSVYYIKRIIGLPGETVILDGTTVTIKNKQHPEGFTLNEPYISNRNEKEDSLTKNLLADEYFVLGDNRRESSDSRSWGVLPKKFIVGTPFVRLFPFDRISFRPGLYPEPK